jgi:hypothetical protein
VTIAQKRERREEKTERTQKGRERREKEMKRVALVRQTRETSALLCNANLEVIPARSGTVTCFIGVFLWTWNQLTETKCRKWLMWLYINGIYFQLVLHAFSKFPNNF